MPSHEKAKAPRHVAVALIYSPTTHRLLLITSRAHPHLWILPKGGVEDGETAGQAAVRESWEEAGTPRDLPAPKDADELLTLSLEGAKPQKRGAVWHVHIVPVSEEQVERISTWPEKHQRRRAWFTPAQAIEKIQEWYTDESAKGEVDGETKSLHGQSDHDSSAASDEVHKIERRGKKDRKGGAMEMAVRRLAELKGFRSKYYADSYRCMFKRQTCQWTVQPTKCINIVLQAGFLEAARRLKR